MKVVFVGGGAFRVLGIARGALGEKGVLDGGEISLYDLNVPRAEAMARLIAKTPECIRANCKVTWGSSLEKALVGADLVGVILMAGSQRTFRLGDESSFKHGFLGSDNVSPNGAFLAIKGAPILLNVARKMEKLCPKAWLLDFANPVAVHSGMINNHTKIEAFGVCAGFTNHQWDLARIFGKDEQRTDFNVETAGVNHLSFIVRGRVQGQDLFEALNRRLARGVKVPKLQDQWSKAAKINIAGSVLTLDRFYRELGVLIFSTEGDGLAHLRYDEDLARFKKEFKPCTATQLEAHLKAGVEARQQENQAFQAHLTKDLDAAFWRQQEGSGSWFQRQDHDIFVEIMRGRAGVRKVKVATSRLNNGAVEGFTDRTVLEYSQYIENGRIRPAGHYAVPPVVHGLISGLADHQTMLGDALATDDPKLLAQALMAYPIQPYSQAARALYKDLARINRDEIAPKLRRVTEYL